MRSTSGYASISCILLHQPRNMMAPITRGVPNDKNTCKLDGYPRTKLFDK